jgi:hypothetical protein
MNKDYQAYSDFKEGVNKGLDIARYTFEDNLEKLSLTSSGDEPAEKVRGLESSFNQLLDGIALLKTPNCSQQRLDGVQSVFDISKNIFKEFLNESFSPENT